MMTIQQWCLLNHRGPLEAISISTVLSPWLWVSQSDGWVCVLLGFEVEVLFVSDAPNGTVVLLVVLLMRKELGRLCWHHWKGNKGWRSGERWRLLVQVKKKKSRTSFFVSTSGYELSTLDQRPIPVNKTVFGEAEMWETRVVVNEERCHLDHSCPVDHVHPSYNFYVDHGALSIRLHLDRVLCVN